MKLPHDQIILFDGPCGFCTRSVRFVIRHDKRKTFKFLPIQSDLGKTICRSANLNPDAPDTLLLVTPERIFSRSDAIIAIATQFGGPWRLTGLLKIFPKNLRDSLYRAVATRRHRLLPPATACSLTDTAAIRDRFLA